MRNYFIHKVFTQSIYRIFQNKIFSNTSTFCLFIGYPRSGHTLIGALLDAHPQIVMGIEANTLQKIKNGYSRMELLLNISKQSLRFAYKNKFIWNGYSYCVPGGKQGKLKIPEIIGDMTMGKSAALLAKEPELLSAYDNQLKLPIKIIHIIRNPFDSISTMVIQNMASDKNYDRSLHLKKITAYINKVNNCETIRDNGNFEIFDLYHEEIIRNPKQELQKIINFLGLIATDKYLENCTSIIKKEAHLSRFELHWPEDLKAMVQEKINNTSFLNKYRLN